MSLPAVSRDEESSEATGTAADRRRIGRGFLGRLTVVTAGGMFVDGYIFAVIAVTMALQTFHNALGLTSMWAGLISASPLIGIFVGGAVFGYLTDKIGRKHMYTADLAAFVVASILLFFVREPWHMFALGLFLGLAIGADYAIGSPLLSEFAPNASRGRVTSSLQLAWNLGYVVAFALGYVVTAMDPEAWRWVLASATVPAVACLIGRYGLPESPRWLLSKGRRDEAEAVLGKVGLTLGSEDFGSEHVEQTRYWALFSREQIGRTIFACVFWICLVLPYFAIIFFQSTVLEALGIQNPIVTALLGTVIVLAGAVLGWLLVERVGRRKLLIIPMWVTGIALAIVSFDRGLPAEVIVVCFFAYLFAYGVASILCGVYPMEVFPTALRTSGVGLASSASRIGAAIGTFLLPSALVWWGVTTTMLLMAGVCVIGAIVAQYMAPETTGRALSEISAPKNKRGNA